MPLKPREKKDEVREAYVGGNVTNPTIIIGGNNTVISSTAGEELSYAPLYGFTRDELRYILDPKEVHGISLARHSAC